MQVYDPLIWLLQTFGLFIAFTVQGAMWKARRITEAVAGLWR